MFFMKWLNKIPYFRNRRITKTRESLSLVRTNFDEGLYSDDAVVRLHNILKSPVTSYEDDLVNGTVKRISLCTNSSMKALSILEKREVKKSNLEKSTLLKLDPEERYFSYWYSNQASVETFISTMLELTGLYTLSIASPSPVGVNGTEVQPQLDERTISFLESLTFRLLMLDTVSILEFYLESKYD